MTNGQRCHLTISSVLDTLELDIEQKAKLSKILDSTSGGYEPTNLMDDLLDINEMYLDGDVNGLLARLKIYPQAPKARELIFYLDGEECSKTTFMDMEHILGIRSIGGAEAPSEDTNTMWMSTGDRPDSDFAKGGLSEKNSIMKNSTSGSGRQGGFHSSDHEKM